jgi:predicted NAD-dependent protein-ADP-ribosyltransferase YbiA (DUF1768 family)
MDSICNKKILNKKTCRYRKICGNKKIRNKTKKYCIKQNKDFIINITRKYLMFDKKDIKNMYDENIVFRYSSISDDKHYPGFGDGEKIPEVYKDQYYNLSLIKNWRQKLSNFWFQPFILDSKKWATVENYYQACKFKKNNPDFYNLFSLDSKIDIELLKKWYGEITDENLEKSKNFYEKLKINAGYAKHMGKITPSKKWKKKIFRPQSIKIDPEFNHESVIFKATFSKFNQNEDLKYMLLCTQNANLTHPVFEAGGESKIISVNNLIYIRNLFYNISK